MLLVLWDRPFAIQTYPSSERGTLLPRVRLPEETGGSKNPALTIPTKGARAPLLPTLRKRLGWRRDQIWLLDGGAKPWSTRAGHTINAHVLFSNPLLRKARLDLAPKKGKTADSERQTWRVAGNVFLRALRSKDRELPGAMDATLLSSAQAILGSLKSGLVVVRFGPIVAKPASERARRENLSQALSKTIHECVRSGVHLFLVPTRPRTDDARRALCGPILLCGREFRAGLIVKKTVTLHDVGPAVMRILKQRMRGPGTTGFNAVFR